MGFKAKVDSLSPAPLCHLRTMIPRAISGCQSWALNPDRSPVRRARYYCASPAQALYTAKKVFNNKHYEHLIT